MSTFELEMTAHNVNMPPILMTGDYSNSYEPIHSLLQYWTRAYASLLQQAELPSDWVLVFSRANNAKHHENVDSHLNHLTSIDESRCMLTFTTIDEKQNISIHMDRFVIDISDDIRDKHYYFPISISL